MIIDAILDLFFSLSGGQDLFFLGCASIIIAGIMAPLINRFKNV